MQPPPQQQPAPPVAPAGPSEEELEALANYAPYSVRVGGYMQPQFRFRQNSPQGEDENGFRFARVRPQITASTQVGHLEFNAKMEVEVQPQFTMLDAYVGATRSLPENGKLTVDVGQMRTPVSREQMISDANLSFVDRAQMTTLSTERDFGARLTFTPPKIRQVRIVAGSFNGEGRNKVQNQNESFLHAGRLEITPIGKQDPLVEGAFNGTYLTFGIGFARNKLNKGSAHEIVEYRTYDISGSYKGLTASYEYIDVSHDVDFDDPSGKYHANGWSAYLTYLLPLKLAPFKHGRLEIGFRAEEVDRNDTIPINAPGEAAQSVRELTGVISYYLRQHSVKLQLALNHFTEIEDRTAANMDAKFDNDQAVLQLTYRLE